MSLTASLNTTLTIFYFRASAKHQPILALRSLLYDRRLRDTFRCFALYDCIAGKNQNATVTLHVRLHFATCLVCVIILCTDLSSILLVITGSIARSATRRYLIYSEADFEVFRPAGATRCALQSKRPIVKTSRRRNVPKS